jgi:hypothetical protein
MTEYFIEKSTYSRVKLYRLTKGFLPNQYGKENYREIYLEEVCEGEISEIAKLWEALNEQDNPDR